MAVVEDVNAVLVQQRLHGLPHLVEFLEGRVGGVPGVVRVADHPACSAHHVASVWATKPNGIVQLPLLLILHTRNPWSQATLPPCMVFRTLGSHLMWACSLLNAQSAGASPGGLAAVDGLQVVQEPVVLRGADGVVDVGGDEDDVGGAHVHLRPAASLSAALRLEELYVSSSFPH